VCRACARPWWRRLPAISNPESEVPGSLGIDMGRVVPYTFKQSWKPAYLAGAGQIAFGFISRDIDATTVAATTGRIVLVKESEIRPSVTTVQTGPGSPFVRMPLVVR